MSSHSEKELADYLKAAIDNDYLINLLITSHTQGKLKSQNMPFGLGKTTLEFWLNYYLNGKSWDKVFETTKYNPYDFVRLFNPELRLKEGRLAAVSYDDIQATAPAEQGVPRAIRRLANYLTTSRPEVAAILGTADNINSISSPLRKIFLFEIIVSERGVYEVQKITYHKNYKRPLHDLGRLEYLEEGTFPKLPSEVYERYRLWRMKEKMKLYPALEGELCTYAKLRDWTPEDLEADGMVSITCQVVKPRKHDYGIIIPEEIGAKLYNQRVKVVIARE